MRNRYEGKSEAELLKLRGQLQDQVASGQVLRTSIAGVSVEKAQASAGATAAALIHVQYALWLIGEAHVADVDSEITVNPYENPYTATVKRTRPSYV